jgi:hypothetical protein
MTAEAEHGRTPRGAPSPANHKPHMKLRSTASTLARRPRLFKQPQPNWVRSTAEAHRAAAPGREPECPCGARASGRRRCGRHFISRNARGDRRPVHGRRDLLPGLEPALSMSSDAALARSAATAWRARRQEPRGGMQAQLPLRAFPPAFRLHRFPDCQQRQPFTGTGSSASAIRSCGELQNRHAHRCLLGRKRVRSQVCD